MYVRLSNNIKILHLNCKSHTMYIVNGPISKKILLVQEKKPFQSPLFLTIFINIFQYPMFKFLRRNSKPICDKVKFVTADSIINSHRTPLFNRQNDFRNIDTLKITADTVSPRYRHDHNHSRHPTAAATTS